MTWPEPIPVSERLPEVSGRYLVLMRGKFDAASRWYIGHWAFDRERNFLWISDEESPMPLGGVTHWMELPPSPTAAQERC